MKLIHEKRLIATRHRHLREKNGRRQVSLWYRVSRLVSCIMDSIQSEIWEGIFWGSNAPFKEASQKQVINQ